MIITCLSISTLFTLINFILIQYLNLLMITKKFTLTVLLELSINMVTTNYK